MLSNFTEYLEKFNEFGVVEAIHHPIVRVKGLPGAKPNEILVFANQTLGQILILEENALEVLLFSSNPVAVGMRVARSGEIFSLPLSRQLLGLTINPLGQNLLNDTETPSSDSDTNYRPVDIPALSIVQRYQITEPLLTGISIVDLLLPLGKGQRELVIGDRKTGKTTFLLSALKNQINLGNIGIYVAIGKQLNEIEFIRQWLNQQQITSRTTLVAASAQDAQSMIYLAPFTGMTLAEYFRDQGEDVLIILDDLSTHAKFYREISLLAGRFPGRDSYPGDIFFTHARLLERAGNYLHPSKGTASISCLPVAETIENDFSDYIVTNLIGITDGHLLFDSAEFTKGRRPPINPNLSVTRVGRQTQSLLHQDISQRLIIHIANYQQSQKFAHFGAELGEEAKNLLKKGELLYSFFDQEPGVVISLPIQILFIALIWNQWFTDGTLNTPPELTEYAQRLSQTYAKDEKFKSKIDQYMENDDWFQLLDQIKLDKNMIVKICQGK